MDRRIERGFENVLERVPGYRGYRDKEDRRDADRRVRDHVAQVYAAQASRIQDIAANLANQRQLDAIGPVDAFGQRLRHLIDRISTATYGYGGLWSDRDVDSAALDQLRRFDEGLLAGATELDRPISDLEPAHQTGGDLRSAAQAGETVVQNLLARFDLRSEVIETGRPASQDRVLAVLEPAQPTTPRPAFNLNDHDALAILGDDYVVDGRIAIGDDDHSLRLFRLGGGKAEQWLLVPRHPDQTIALLRPASIDKSANNASETSIGGVTFITESTGSGDGEASGISGTSGQRTVSYELLTSESDSTARAAILDWGDERQVLAGKEVHPNDIELFGSTTTR